MKSAKNLLGLPSKDKIVLAAGKPEHGKKQRSKILSELT